MSAVQIPEPVEKILLHYEDRRFWSHAGIDGKAIVRAVWVRLHGGPVQGASTIDQQVIKLDQQAYRRSRSQKIYEMRYAWILQNDVAK